MKRYIVNISLKRIRIRLELSLFYRSQRNSPVGRPASEEFWYAGCVGLKVVRSKNSAQGVLYDCKPLIIDVQAGGIDYASS